ncbi:hypothetical protein [Glutamicibacter sp. TV12E]|uniref:hypothetical protein n=1 Tax=Glutamicibacter sp. TV12E TaxID=3446362 RepID=UPI0040339765
MITTADLDQMTTREDWLGFGYLGERRNMQLDDETENFTPEEARALVAKADTMVLDRANELEMTADQLFDQWANQRVGRWYADCWFGADGKHAEGYLPYYNAANLTR